MNADTAILTHFSMEEHPVYCWYDQSQRQCHIVEPPVDFQAPRRLRLVTGLLYQAPGAPHIEVPAGDLYGGNQHGDRTEPKSPVGHVDEELSIAKLNDNAHDVHAQEKQCPNPSVEQVYCVDLIFLPLQYENDIVLAI